MTHWSDRYTISIKLTNNLDTKQAITIAMVSKAITREGFDPPVLVGGAAVSIYTKGIYGTVDIDFVTNCPDLDRIMGSLGYSRRGKDYINTSLDSYVEFPSGPLNGNESLISDYYEEVSGDSVKVIGIEDLILDRLGSYHATKDLDSLEWARRLMLIYYQNIEWPYLHRESNRRNFLKITEIAQRDLKRYKDLYEKGNPFKDLKL